MEVRIGGKKLLSGGPCRNARMHVLPRGCPAHTGVFSGAGVHGSPILKHSGYILKYNTLVKPILCVNDWPG